MQAKEYDLFISYVDADRAWVEGYLLDALNQTNVRYLVETAFTLGVSWIAEFERAIEQSDLTLLVLSHAYLANDTNRFIDLLAQSYGRDKGIWPVIPLIRDETLELPPSLSALVPLEAINEDEWEKAIERLCQHLQRSVPDAPSKPECPYPGMRPFSEEKSDRFFGRDQEIKQLLQHLRHHNFVSVIGPSGSGKSSLVFAGLIPALERSGLFEDGKWLIRTIRPGEEPLTALKKALESDLANPTLAVTTALATEDNARRLLLVVDQFEEVFTQAEQEAVPFQEVLLGLLEIPDCYVILTVRADFYPELMESMLWDQIQISRLEIVPLNAEGLREAITKPAEKVKVFIESVLVERLVADAAEEPGVLPIVQEAMVWLWEKLERRFLPFRAYDTLVLTSTSYEKIDGSNRKGLQAVIANHADSTVIKLSKEEQQIAWRIFLRLIQFGEGRADTRRQQSVEQLKALDDNPELFDKTLNYLAENRLLTLNAGKDGSSINVDIAHEALIEGWPALQWRLEKRREAEQTRRRLMRQVQDWVNLGKGKGGLLDETELAEAGRWLSSPDADELGYDETLLELVEASDQQIQAAKKRKKRTLATVIATAGLAIIAAFGFVFQQNQTLQNQIYFLTTSSEAHLLDDAQLEALVESIKAGRKLKQPTFWMPNSIRIRTAATLQQAVYQTHEINRLEDHRERVNSVNICSNGQMLASGSDDGTIRLWKQDGSGKVNGLLKGHQDRVTSVAFSPDCKILAYTSADGKVNLWDFAKGIVIRKLEGHKGGPKKGWVNGVSFSPDGKIFATVSRDQTVKLWNTDNGNLLKTLEGHVDSVNGVNFSPDGNTLASAGNDGTVKLWNTDGTLIQDLPTGHKNGVTNVMFSPDGQILATASADKTVKLWNLKDGLVETKEEGHILNGHDKEVTSVCFSSDSKFMVSASQDSTLKLWRVADGKLQKTLRGHTGKVWSISCHLDEQTQTLMLMSAGEDKIIRLWSIPPLETCTQCRLYTTSFSPDGQKFAAAGWDGIVWVWSRDKTTPKLLFKTQESHKSSVKTVSFSPNGQILASGSDDKTIQLWDSNDGSLTRTLKGHQGLVTSISFHPDSKILASASDSKDPTIKLWNLTDETLLETLEVNQDGVSSVTFSPNGKILASGSYDNTVKLWRLDGTLLETLPGHGSAIAALSFSPDGKTLASASWDNTIKLWRVKDRSLLDTLTLRGHKDGVTSVTFSSDGKTLVSGSADQTIRFWNPKDGTLLKILRGETNRVESVSFSPNGKLMISASEEEGLLLWNLDLEDLLKRGCDRIRDYLKTNPNVSESDRQICQNF
ncbi:MULTISPECIES: TIR domain-containing protein [unclassified Moorena]|uniref:nSTAND1 domain-containing NTPase n=1 Tax=unclassified Moorena TaxID=2683338 RepID=UPI0013C83866|nr:MULTISPECIES: TIR domain-containing protein [unclassified Moorena]NEO21990.1 TIR domain-containing protein [Moorena sp. SIO4A5]NEQ61322.1 TIR domain-containing protein [Moorena sp. SIO4A1]